MTERTLAAVDPGVEGVGLAIGFGSGVVLLVEYRPFDSLSALRLDLRHRAERLICEVPQAYRTGLLKGDPNDLIAVALVAGVALSSCDVVRRVHPHTWKGNVPKDIHNARILAKATPAVRASLSKIRSTVRHNAIDALGLYQWAVENWKVV